MTDLVIKEHEFRNLDTLIGDLPTKYGMPIAQFFHNIQRARIAEAQAEAQAAAQLGPIPPPQPTEEVIGDALVGDAVVGNVD